MVVSPAARPILAGIDLAVGDGELAVLVGPSGAGKTTLLRAIAGLTPVAAGAVKVDGRRIDGTPAHTRAIGLVFQEPRLFPHLTAADNVAFALRVRRVGRVARRAQALALLEEVGLAAAAGRPAGDLSGGEQQRVALARALAAEPQLLLLDEPFAAVDPNRRDALRRLLVRVQRVRGLTMLLVTHDRVEAAELGDSIGVMLDGRLHQHDTPEAVFERPASPAVARFLGAATIIRGRVDGGELSIAGGSIGVDGPDGLGAFTIRPEHIVLDPDGPLELRVADARYAGSHTRLVLVGDGLTVEAHTPAGQAPPAGTLVRVVLPANRLWRFPDAPGLAERRVEVVP